MDGEIFSTRKKCRLCNDARLILVLPIAASPVADAFVNSYQLMKAQPLAPLDLYQCLGCGHVQNLDIVDPELLFRDYIFTTSSSPALVAHFERYATDIKSEFGISPGSLVVEIGSNDGTLLNFFQGFGMRVIGIDPARDIAEEANNSGIPTIPEYFSASIADQIQKDHGLAKLIVANNVYAHSDELGVMTEAIASLLDTDGIFVFEVSYLVDIIEKFLFDTVYHEHLSYHSIKPLVHFFAAHGLHLFDVQRISSKGGSIRGFVQHINGPQDERPIVGQMICEEDLLQLHSPGVFKIYEQEILKRKASLLEFLAHSKKRGLTIAGYGASTTVTTLMYHFELTDKISYLIDDNPKKHGMFSPGCHLEVKPATALYGEDRPDIVVVLAWQYADPIITKNKKFVESGGTFVVPLPDMFLMPPTNI